MKDNNNATKLVTSPNNLKGNYQQHPPKISLKPKNPNASITDHKGFYQPSNFLSDSVELPKTPNQNNPKQQQYYLQTPSYMNSTKKPESSVTPSQTTGLDDDSRSANSSSINRNAQWKGHAQYFNHEGNYYQSFDGKSVTTNHPPSKGNNFNDRSFQKTNNEAVNYEVNNDSINNKSHLKGNNFYKPLVVKNWGIKKPHEGINHHERSYQSQNSSFNSSCQNHYSTVITGKHIPKNDGIEKQQLYRKIEVPWGESNSRDKFENKSNPGSQLPSFLIAQQRNQNKSSSHYQNSHEIMATASLNSKSSLTVRQTLDSRLRQVGDQRNKSHNKNLSTTDFVKDTASLHERSQQNRFPNQKITEEADCSQSSNFANSKPNTVFKICKQDQLDRIEQKDEDFSKIFVRVQSRKGNLDQSKGNPILQRQTRNQTIPSRHQINASKKLESSESLSNINMMIRSDEIQPSYILNQNINNLKFIRGPELYQNEEKDISKSRKQTQGERYVKINDDQVKYLNQNAHESHNPNRFTSLKSPEKPISVQPHINSHKIRSDSVAVQNDSERNRPKLNMFSPNHRNQPKSPPNHYLSSESFNNENQQNLIKTKQKNREKKSVKKLLDSQSKNKNDVYFLLKYENLLLTSSKDSTADNLRQESGGQKSNFVDSFLKNHIKKVFCATFKIGENQNGCNCQPKCIWVTKWMEQSNSNPDYKKKSLLKAPVATKHGKLLESNKVSTNSQSISRKQEQNRHGEQDRQTMVQIQKDIPRTCPEHPTFRSERYQQRLRETLVSFYELDKSLGYVQGMNLIAAAVIFHCPSDYEALYLMDFLMNVLGLRNLYEDDMSRCRDLAQKTCVLLKKYCHDMYVHVVEECGVDLQMFIVGWYLSMMCTFVPLQSMHLIIDAFIHKNMMGLLEIVLAYFLFIRDILMSTDDESEIMQELSLQRMVGRSKKINWEQLVKAASKINVEFHDKNR